MELRKIKDLMSAMRRVGMNRLRYEDADCKLELEYFDAAAVPREAAPVQVLPASNPLPASAPAAAESEEKEVSGKFVTSPIVGTYYSSSSPEADPFVKVGDTVDEDTVVCIVEAMKVMNEVKSGVKGKVVEILVDNAHPVEFGTKLYRVV